MTRERSALVCGALGSLVAVSVAELGSDPTEWRTGPALGSGVLGPLVRAADGQWDPALLRAIAVLAGVLCVAGLIACLLVRAPRWRCRIAIGTAVVVVAALTMPATLLQIGLRDGTAPWFHVNDSSYQIEIAGDLLLDGSSPYGRSYDGTGMERVYGLDGTAPDDRAAIVALDHFPYFPGMALFGAAAQLAPAPFDDARFAVLLCTLALLPATLLLRGSLTVRLIAGAVLAANPLSVRAAWFGTADAPALLLLVLAFACVQRRRLTPAFALVGAAILLKQFAIVALPFLALEAWRLGRFTALRRPLLALLAVVGLPILGFAVSDAAAFVDDTITFGAETYRVIGYGLSGLLVEAGLIERAGSYPFAPIALVTWLPATLLLLLAQRRAPAPWLPAAGFAASMLLLVFIARVFQTSYLVYPLVGAVIAVVLATDRRAAA